MQNLPRRNALLAIVATTIGGSSALAQTASSGAGRSSRKREADVSLEGRADHRTESSRLAAGPARARTCRQGLRRFSRGRSSC